MEGTTRSGDFFVVTTSQIPAPKKDPKGYVAKACPKGDADFQRLTRFKMNADNKSLEEEYSVNLRAGLMQAMDNHFTPQDADWFSRVTTNSPKLGGLNIEGISRTDKNNTSLIWGLRSPLWDKNFGNPKHNKDHSLAVGKAILAHVEEPFSAKPAIRFYTVDLKGHGVRGMEWIPELQGYVIIGGPTIKGKKYSLWLWHPNNQNAQPLALPGFKKLFRPESVLSISENGKSFLVITSERGQAACAAATDQYDYIQTEIKVAK